MAKKKNVDLLIDEGTGSPAWQALLSAATDKEKFLINALEDLLQKHSELQSRYDSAVDEINFNYD